jgi:hypothetical protein
VRAAVPRIETTIPWTIPKQDDSFRKRREKSGPTLLPNVKFSLKGVKTQHLRSSTETIYDVAPAQGDEENRRGRQCNAVVRPVVVTAMMCQVLEGIRVAVVVSA